MNVNIVNVFAPSEAQKKSNIFGNVNIEIVANDGTLIVRLSGITLRKTKSQDYFLSMPSYDYTKDGEKQYRKHFDLFPLKSGDENKSFNDEQKKRAKALTDEVIRLANNGGTQKPSNNPSKAASVKPVSAPASKPEPWAG